MKIAQKRFGLTATYTTRQNKWYSSYARIGTTKLWLNINKVKFSEIHEFCTTNWNFYFDCLIDRSVGITPVVSFLLKNIDFFKMVCLSKQIKAFNF